ncbi:arginine--tRNA ligase [Paenibacillus sp. NPDC058071]|uniref:arginine--tRNA ligase n=1 Tax=Paenibacillus sp. NPDC058071 TaxID=3346326 RepID=UPI0036D90782
MFKSKIAAQLSAIIPLSELDVQRLLEVPANLAHGDIAFPCFTLAKVQRKSPAQLAAELAPLAQSEYWTATAAGPYLNFALRRTAAAKIGLSGLQDGLPEAPNLGDGKRVIIDMSSPNIAKPFGIGHLRSTMIGNALYRLLAKVGYETVNVNHLGDWGTQFGKMIAAYLEWGDDATIANDPIKGYLDLYVQFHREAEQRPELETAARAWFAKLEAGDDEALRHWNKFAGDSKAAFQKLYDRLGVHFDHVLGESFYNDKMDAVVQELDRQGLLEESEGAMVVRLDEEGLPPAIIKKSDGTSIYATRDLATAIYRHEEMGGDELLYVVGAEQSLHFRQLFLVLEKMGLEWAARCKHIPFGLMRLNGTKMSTRKGQVVFLEDVLNEAVGHARLKIEEKNPALADKEAVAEAVGIGAVVFSDLLHTRTLPVDFQLEEIVSFDGETGPYVQYAYARIQRLQAKAADEEGLAGAAPGDRSFAALADEAFQYAEDDSAWQLITAVLDYPAVLAASAERCEPSVLAKYLVDLAQTFNRFYHRHRILADNADERSFRLALANAAGSCLRDGMSLLGIQTPSEI